MKDVIYSQVNWLIQQKCFDDAMDVFAQLYEESQIDEMREDWLSILEKNNISLVEYFKKVYEKDIEVTVKQKISFVNSLKTNKELKEFCKKHKIKQSRYGITNKYTKRWLILEYLLKREVTYKEEVYLDNFIC